MNYPQKELQQIRLASCRLRSRSNLNGDPLTPRTAGYIPTGGPHLPFMRQFLVYSNRMFPVVAVVN